MLPIVMLIQLSLDKPFDVRLGDSHCGVVPIIISSRTGKHRVKIASRAEFCCITLSFSNLDNTKSSSEAHSLQNHLEATADKPLRNGLMQALQQR